MDLVKIYMIYFVVVFVVVLVIETAWLRNKRKKRWGVYETANEAHVVPDRDLIKHSIEDCACSPQTVPVERKDGSVGWKVIHKAMDGRE